MCCLIKTVRRSRPVMEVRKKMATVLGMLLDTTQFSFNDIVRIIIVEVAALWAAAGFVYKSVLIANLINYSGGCISLLQRTALSFCCILFQGFRAAPSKRPLVSSYRKLDYARQVSRYAVQRHHDYRRSPPTGSSNTLEKRIPPRPFVRKTRLGSNIEFCFELLLHRDFVSGAHPSSFPSFLASNRRAILAWLAYVAFAVLSATTSEMKLAFARARDFCRAARNSWDRVWRWRY